jgi:hypothetical protein
MWRSLWPGSSSQPLQATEIHRASERPTRDLTAYDLYLRALASFPWSGKAQLVEARDLLDEAIERDPLYAPAIAWAAVCHLRLGYAGYADEPETSRRKALAFAERALALDDRDPGVLANAAHVLGLRSQPVTTKAFGWVFALKPRCDGRSHCLSAQMDGTCFPT